MSSPIGQFSDSSPAALKMTGVGSISGGEAASRLESYFTDLSQKKEKTEEPVRNRSGT